MSCGLGHVVMPELETFLKALMNVASGGLTKKALLLGHAKNGMQSWS